MDIIKQISSYISSKVQLNAPITSPILKSDSSSVAIRETPSSIENRYMNKDKTVNFQFQILVKDPSVITARNISNEIYEKLDGLSKGTIISDDDSFFMTKCECYTLPNWVEITEQNEHIFTAIFNAELEQGGI